MRVWVSLAAVVMLAAAMITGCSSINSNQPVGVAGKSNSSVPNVSATPPDNVRRMTITELRDALEQGKAVVVDVRGDPSYKQEHIKGALDIPEGQLVARSSELPKDKLIVFYCS